MIHTYLYLMLVRRSTNYSWVNHTFGNQANSLMFIAMQARLATGASTAQVNHWPSTQIFLRRDILLHRGLRSGPKYGWFSAHYLCILCFQMIENKKTKNCCNSQQQQYNYLRWLIGSQHRGYAVVRLSPVIEIVGVTHIPPQEQCISSFTPCDWGGRSYKHWGVLVTPAASITGLKQTTA